MRYTGRPRNRPWAHGITGIIAIISGAIVAANIQLAFWAAIVGIIGSIIMGDAYHLRSAQLHAETTETILTPGRPSIPPMGYGHQFRAKRRCQHNA